MFYSSNHNSLFSARLFPEEISVRTFLPDGKIGLELETQRIDQSGHLALTPHPFEEEPYIDRDFGEAQIEINTPPAPGTEEVQALLHEQLRIAHVKLAGQGELLWPFSNPPAIDSDADIRIAEYTGELEKKTVYRRYLAAKYGKKKMTLCGIHFNYSFSEELLKKNFALSGRDDFRAYKNALYLQLAEKVLQYGWVIVALLAASPLVDGTYDSSGECEQQEKHKHTVFTGYSSLRCSREGYWNMFDPVLSYKDISSYTESIRQYREKGLLRHEGELYYPVRIKPAGKYSLRNLCGQGVSHIELRMIDLNPLSADGIDQRDLCFLQMFLIWLAGKGRMPLDEKEQKRALRNLKEAARFDWNDIRISLADGSEGSAQQELEHILAEMTELFCDVGPAWQEALQHQKDKVRYPEKRYAQQVMDLYGGAYLEQGLKRAEELQQYYTQKGIAPSSAGGEKQVFSGGVQSPSEYASGGSQARSAE